MDGDNSMMQNSMTPKIKGKEHSRANAQDVAITRTDGTGCTRLWIAVIFVSLVLAGLLIAPVSGVWDATSKDLGPVPKGTPAVMYYQDFARNLLNTHPELKTMSDMDKAKYAFSAYSRELRRVNGIYVNGNLADRSIFGGEHTCSWHTDNLQKIMRVLGVKEVHSIVADKKTWKPLDENSPDFLDAASWNFLDVNSNHQAVLVIVDGKQYAFDIWKMAVDNHGVYKDLDANSDRFNGMPIEDWNAIMLSLDYIRFAADAETVDTADIWYPTSSEAVKHINPVHRDTQIVATGWETVTVPEKSEAYKNFTIPAGYKGTGLRATYDFSIKPPSEQYLQVVLWRKVPNSINADSKWMTVYWGENNGMDSGQIRTEGSLETLVLEPGDYLFGASKGRSYTTLDDPGYSTPIPASLTYYLSAT